MGANVQHGQADQPAGSATHAVVEALYDLPLGGSWRQLQEALCRFWVDEDSADRNEALLERHFQRALAILQRSPEAEPRWRTDLHRLPVPACVLDATARLVDANSGGRKHLALESDTSVELPVSGRIALQDAIRRLEADSLLAVRYADKDGGHTRIFLQRIPRSDSQSNDLFLAVIINTALPDSGPAALRQQFGLTDRESKLCLQLASGTSLDELAKKAEVKKSTLRSHLANSFIKLGVHSQPELVSLVLHTVFTAAHLEKHNADPPKLTPFLDPELHGHPKFTTVTLSDDRRLGFFEYGDPDGLPAIYLHGSLDCGLFMKMQRLSGNGVRLIAVERYGVGESSPNPDSGPDAYARDLIALIDHLGLSAYAVIGRSMGSWDAVSLADADPERARLLVLVSGRLPVSDYEQHRENSRFFQALFQSIWHSATVGKLMLQAMQLQVRLRGPQTFLSDNEDLPAVERKLISNPEYQRHMRSVWLRSGLNGTESVHAHLALYRTPVVHPPWEELDTPTVLIHGEQDKNVPIDLLLKQTQGFRNRKVVLLPDAGHRLAHFAMREVLGHTTACWSELPPQD